MRAAFLVGVGGFLGAVSRFGLSSWVKMIFKAEFPFATLLVNVLGCLAIGFLFGGWKEHPRFGELFLVLGVGFLGGFTTFSAFGLETLQLLRTQGLSSSLLNVGAQVFFCLGAVALGDYLGRTI